MTKTMLTAFAACLFTGVFGTNAKADIMNGSGPAAPDPAMVVNAGWYGFCFAGPGGAATAGCQNAGIGVTGNDITFTVTTNVLFNVTDAFEKGDTFTVDINPGALTFTTDSVPVDPSGTTVDPNAAFADPTYSHGSWLLGPGTYTVDIFADAAPFGPGGAYAELVTAPVPEPSGILLLITAIALIGGGTRARKNFAKKAL